MRDGIVEDNAIFLNVPYDSGYERLFVALICAVVASGFKPRCALEVAELGDGQLSRVVNLIRRCRLSIHDLSQPRRHNMPFELGIAVAFKLSGISKNRGFILLDSRRGRLQQSLSDMKGIEPIVHGNGPLRLMAGVLDLFQGMAPRTIESIYRKMLKTLPTLKRRYHSRSIYQRRIFNELVAGAVELATRRD